MGEKSKSYYDRMVAAGGRRSQNILDERQSPDSRKASAYKEAVKAINKSSQYVDYVDYATLGKGGPLKRWPNGRSKPTKGE